MKNCREAQSIEKKMADQDKDRLSKKRCREAESIEKKMAEQVKKRLYMKRCREAEKPNKAAIQKSNNNASMKRKRHDESVDAATKRKSNNNASMKIKRHDESVGAATKQKSNINASMKRKRQLQISHDKEMSNAIERAMKEAKKILHRTQHPSNPLSHKAIVCIICDRFIIGTEKIYKLTKHQISQHSNRLSVKTYETYHGETLKVKLRKQYQVNGDKLNDLLLSP
jgi:hypothetical protein